MSRRKEALRIAADIQAAFPEHAATIRSWNFGGVKKNPETQAKYRRWALLKLEHEERVGRGEDEDEALLALMPKYGLNAGDDESEGDWNDAIDIVGGKWQEVNKIADQLRSQING